MHDVLIIIKKRFYRKLSDGARGDETEMYTHIIIHSIITSILCGDGGEFE